MNTYKTRLGAVIELDADKEQDIITTLENLKAKHKLSSYTIALYRVAHNNQEVAQLVEDELNGVPNTRNHFFSDLSEQVQHSQEVLNKLEGLLIELKASFLTGKSIGIPQKLDNTALGLLSVENQLREIRRILNPLKMEEDGSQYVHKIDSITDDVLLNIEKVLEQLQIQPQMLMPSYPQAQDTLQNTSPYTLSDRQTRVDTTQDVPMFNGYNKNKVKEEGATKYITEVATVNAEDVSEEEIDDLAAFCGI